MEYKVRDKFDMEPRIGNKKLSDFAIGDKFYERGIEMQVTEVPEKTWCEGLEANQWKWRAQSSLGRGEINYLITEGLEHYGPSLELHSGAHLWNLPPEAFKGGGK